jgi:mono/diheme cytochrome c family protein
MGLVRFLIAMVVGAVVAGAILVFIVMPRMQWNATAPPSAAERWIAGYALSKWVSTNASDDHNPIAASAENLRDGEHEYDEHCAVCHGLDGNAQNRIGADFSPPIVRLNSGLRRMPDGKFYFIVSSGIRMTGMPGFGTRHSTEDLWKIILWVRHFPDLTAQERGAIEGRMKGEENEQPAH